jgi:hypothetical protein
VHAVGEFTEEIESAHVHVARLPSIGSIVSLSFMAIGRFIGA